MNNAEPCPICGRHIGCVHEKIIRAYEEHDGIGGRGMITPDEGETMIRDEDISQCCMNCEKLAKELETAKELLRRVPHSLSSEMEGLDKDIDLFLYGEKKP